jgi:hypothetical protein
MIWLLFACGDKDSDTTNTTAEAPVEDCSDQIDNDNDGFTDCNDQDCFNDDACIEEEVEANICLSVNPTVLVFPDTSAMHDGGSAQQSINLTNCGDDTVSVIGLQTENSSIDFLIPPLQNPILYPGNSITTTISFTPQSGGSKEETLLIESTDPNNPVIEVQMSGVGIAPVITEGVDSLTFEDIPVGCEYTDSVVISNTGTSSLIVNDIVFEPSSSEFSYTIPESLEFPFTISAETEAEIPFSYRPFDESNDLAYFIVSSNEPNSPEWFINLSGSGIIEETHTDSTIATGAQTDIVFAVDRSCSMGDLTANINNSFDIFFDTLNSFALDYQVSAVVGDDGCVWDGTGTNGAFIDNTYTSTDAQSVIGTMIDCFSATDCNLNVPYGGNTEKAFTLFESFLSEAVDINGIPNPSGCNYGIIRESASLHLVGVSDEPEQSVNPYDHYVSLFQSFKSDPDSVVFHAIGGDHPNGCGQYGAYTGMYEAVTATGGTFVSICGDMDIELASLATGISLHEASTNSIALSQTPATQGESFTVYVNGTEMTQGWWYKSSNNTIVFEHSANIVEGDSIDVEYPLPSENCP